MGCGNVGQVKCLGIGLLKHGGWRGSLQGESITASWVGRRLGTLLQFHCSMGVEPYARQGGVGNQLYFPQEGTA